MTTLKEAAVVDQAIISLLDDLMTKDRDATEGYKKASANVSEIKMKEMFIRFAKQRESFVDDLKNEIEQLGGTYSDKSSTLSTMHRIWIDIMGTFTGKDINSILKESLRGEEASLKDYDEALENKFIPDSSRAVITRNRDKVKKAVDELKKYIDNDGNDESTIRTSLAPDTMTK